MNRFSVILVASASTLLLSAATTHRARPADARTLHLRAEATRLRAHFDSVDRELRARDVSQLNVRQRAMRIKLIAWLRDYRNAGIFPENDRFTDRAMPFFRDSHGTLCAMAYLVDRSGGGDIVDHIAKTRNNAFIRELTDDQALVAWLDASGLTVDEAARIQPQYGPAPTQPTQPSTDRANTDYALLSMGLGGASIGSLGVNLIAPSRASSGFGLVAGMASIVAGAARLGDDGTGDKKIAVANTALGSLAAIAAVRAIFTTRASHQRAATEASRHRLVSDATLSPDLSVQGGASRLGLRLHATF